jgi:hypothetical protein
MSTDYDSDLWENARKSNDILMLGEYENGMCMNIMLRLGSDPLGLQDPTYIEAVESALPSELRASLHDSSNDWATTAKWTKVLVALSKRRALLSLSIKCL